MKIHKEGRKTIYIVFVLLFILFLPVYFVINVVLITILTAIFLGVFFLFIVGFFRHPFRVSEVNDAIILCPADGKIVAIEEVFESEFLQTQCRQISIFMSPLNVHVNTYPVSGKVLYSEHHDGIKLPAFNPKSSEVNERTTIAVETIHNNVIVFRQIAGAVARRIVNYAKKDDIAVQGQEFGFIKFGSRVDVFIPLDMKVQVELNQRVRFSETILARF
ncbi:MAG: phosphatidylserine decarboxylase family protein [Bacteroidales bacterium]